ncbi:MAG: 4Fe-4S dicluster domain-containing protein [Desulfovibrio sp.]|jgi:Fe-S-cluster-containing dehydrogenase component|nr:4Fe-4S dicluster domain-containing protein [Desulfovibrio sp.]
MKRRTFLSFLGVSGVAAVLPTEGKAAPVKDFAGHPDAVGVLHDSVRCIGCRKCEAGCQRANNLPMPAQFKKPAKPFDDLSELDKKRRTHFQQYTVVNKYESSKGKTVFKKFQCNHCQEPACASACFVKAFVKTKEGPVIYKPNLCVGCRYCMIACPFYVPTYDYDSALNPLVYKCTMCYDTRLKKGLLPGCVEICPKDALTFGKRSDLIKVARKRIMDNPGLYVDEIYGETEMGGANWLYISPVAHKELDQPELGKTSAPELTSGALGSVAMVAGIWPVLLGGAYFISKRREKQAAEERDAAVRAAVAETREEAETRLNTALDKAAKEKDAEVAREVKKTREETAREIEAKYNPPEPEPEEADAETEKNTEEDA